MPHSTFHGLPVVEADALIMIRVVEADGGTPNDPTDCAWARGAKRSYPDCGLAAFYRTVAYIETEPGVITRVGPMEKRDGRYVYVGFDPDSAYRRALADFDQTGLMPAMSLVFGPVPVGRTLASRAAAKADAKARPGRVARRLNTGIPNGKPPVLPRGSRERA